MIASFAVLGVVTVVSAAGRPATQIDQFSSLPPGAMVKIDFRQDGCRQADRHILVYHPGAKPTVEVTNVLFPGNKTFNAGSLVLSLKDVRGLDLALDRYRTIADKGQCTTRDMVTYTEMIGGRVVAREMHVDSTCTDIYALEKKGLLDFQRLIWRAKAAM